MVLNFDKKWVDIVYKQLTNNEFPWYFQKQTVGPEALTNALTNDSIQFTHLFYENRTSNSDYLASIKNLLDSKIKYKWIHRIKANLTTQITNNHKSFYRPIHKDIPEDGYKTLLYYVNDSDGDTIFFNDEKETKRYRPKKGTGLLFPSNSLHSACNPIKSKYRIVINYVLKI